MNMVLNYTEVDKRVQKIINVLATLGFSFEIFSPKRIVIIDNNVSFAEKRNIGVITAKGSNVSLKIYGYTKRGKLKSKMKTNEVIFKASATLTDVGSSTRALVKKYRNAQSLVCCDEAMVTASTANFINESDITGLDYLTEYTINESATIREATYEEVYSAYRAVVAEEIDKYYPNLANNPTKREQMITLWTDGTIRTVWGQKFHAYTSEGDDILFAIKMPDESVYIAMAYVPPEKRGRTVAISAFKKLLDESPNGLSLHTNPSNRVVIGLARHFGLQEYPSRNPNEKYFATQDGLAGAKFMQ